MDQHRTCKAVKTTFIDITKNFSSFKFIEDCFLSEVPALHRCFSLGRSFEAQTLVLEELDIAGTGIIKEENDELLQLFPDFKPLGLLRLSFWRSKLKKTSDLGKADPGELIGYAIIKQDCVPSQSYNEWHVFEAVFLKYIHKHNYIPDGVEYSVLIGLQKFKIPGVLYCQQNGLNKSCAHVALRTLLSRMWPALPLSYSIMNQIARTSYSENDIYMPCNGLHVNQIRAILDHFQVGYHDIDYEEAASERRTDTPYQKLLYPGIESGCGGLLGFNMSGPEAGDSLHIIPFFGHTFNKDTWVPDADAAYFNVGWGRYIPSESWTSSFIGHDDNFGPNFCIPRLYVKKENVCYVVELLKPKVKYGGMIAEAYSLQFLQSFLSSPDMNHDSNPWLLRLYKATINEQRVVLRTLSVSRETYLRHWSEVKDWDGNRENGNIIKSLQSELPETLWIVEISLPQLFPANERKIGEIVMDALKKNDLSKDIDFSLFLLVRLPDRFYTIRGQNQYGPSFVSYPSNLKSHVPVLCQNR